MFFQTSKGKESTALCYYNKAGPAGWCGTCYDGDLQPGEEGYCDYYNGKWISFVLRITLKILKIVWLIKIKWILTYCKTGNTELDTPEELSKPSTTDHWGWCANWCGAGQEPAKTLKVRTFWWDNIKKIVYFTWVIHRC